MTTVWIYVDTRKQVGDVDHLKVFANLDAAETCFEENDPEDVAFEYEVLEMICLLCRTSNAFFVSPLQPAF